MVQLIDDDIRSREVLDWRGLHIFHGRTSSCSQKLRIYLNLKGIEWQGHELNLAESETYSEWFLGLNPRGLVPVLVLDGAVHIESNDIITFLEQQYPDPCLFPKDQMSKIQDLLVYEDDLHLDLRALSFRFVFGRTSINKTLEMLERYKQAGRTVGGATDHKRQSHEIDFYDRLAREGITDAAVRASAQKFRTAFNDLDRRLTSNSYYFGDNLSIIDIAWFVYASRLHIGGYPFERLHPNVHSWREDLVGDDRFAREVRLEDGVQSVIARNHADWIQAGTTLADVAGL